jgi:hypothetical protein
MAPIRAFTPHISVEFGRSRRSRTHQESASQRAGLLPSFSSPCALPPPATSASTRELRNHRAFGHSGRRTRICDLRVMRRTGTGHLRPEPRVSADFDQLSSRQDSSRGQKLGKSSRSVVRPCACGSGGQKRPSFRVAHHLDGPATARRRPHPDRRWLRREAGGSQRPSVRSPATGSLVPDPGWRAARAEYVTPSGGRRTDVGERSFVAECERRVGWYGINPRSAIASPIAPRDASQSLPCGEAVARRNSGCCLR